MEWGGGGGGEVEEEGGEVVVEGLGDRTGEVELLRLCAGGEGYWLLGWWTAWEGTRSPAEAEGAGGRVIRPGPCEVAVEVGGLEEVEEEVAGRRETEVGWRAGCLSVVGRLTGSGGRVEEEVEEADGTPCGTTMMEVRGEEVVERGGGGGGELSSWEVGERESREERARDEGWREVSPPSSRSTRGRYAVSIEEGMGGGEEAERCEGW